MTGLNLLTIAAACGGQYVGDKALADCQPNEIVIDSRLVQPGNLFAALPGEKVDGHTFVAKAFDAGAAACLVTHVPEGEIRPCIVVEDVVNAMGDIAAAYRATLQIPIVGITGSVGKTTMKEMISSIIQEKLSDCRPRAPKGISRTASLRQWLQATTATILAQASMTGMRPSS